MKYLILSAHDYRTPRRASIHFLADELNTRGEVRFFSLRYSLLSKLKKDFRSSLDSKSNHVENHNGIECYLWKTLIHPINTRRNYLAPFENILFRLFQKFPPQQLTDWIKDSDVIIIESGLAIIYFEYAKKINPNATFVYRASDDLDTINVAQFIKDYFDLTSRKYDQVCMLSPLIGRNISYKDNLYYVPNGVGKEMAIHGDPNPYSHRKNAVSVGSMLFDLSFFKVASKQFPDVNFHLIGTGCTKDDLDAQNVIFYGHMPFYDTLKYIKHADIGIAPYITNAESAYLADSSMKMVQYDFYKIPSVCPEIVVGKYPNRFGYIPGDSVSIENAMKMALNSKDSQNRPVYYWNEIVDRLLKPQDYPDTKIEFDT